MYEYVGIWLNILVFHLLSSSTFIYALTFFFKSKAKSLEKYIHHRGGGFFFIINQIAYSKSAFVIDDRKS